MDLNQFVASLGILAGLSDELLREGGKLNFNLN